MFLELLSGEILNTEVELRQLKFEFIRLLTE